MFDIEKTLAEYGFTPERYETLLKDCSDKVHKISDIDWSEIAEKYGIEWNGDSLRKAQQPPLLGGAFVREYFSWKNEKGNCDDVDSYSNELMAMKRELERAKIQFRDERNAWQKQNYIDARIENKLDLLDEKLSEIGKVIFEEHDSIEINGDNDLICCLSDLHIGQTFKSNFGKYDSSIARRRLDDYLLEIVRIGRRHNSENIYLDLLGDQISGNIHLSIQVSNRENVIEQVKLSAELIANFAYELSKYFKRVFIIGVAGNHSRLIANKEKDIKDERLDNLIIWIVEKMTEYIDNITVLHRNLDSGISDLLVRGKTYLSVHGDNDDLTSNSVGKLCMMLGFFPYAIISGHKHTPAYQEFNGVKCIQSGSLAGAGDDYTLSKRLSGKPNQTVLVCTEKGIDAIYNVELS